MANPISYSYNQAAANFFPVPVTPNKETLCKRVGKGFTAPFRMTFKVLNTSVENTSALDKTGKFLISILRLVSDIALHIFKVSFIPLKLVINEVGAMVGLISGLNFISRIHEWLAGKNGNSPDKVKSKALLTTAHGIEAGIFFQSMGLVNFGKFVAFLGSIPFLGLIVRIPAKVTKDLFVIGSAIFGIKATLKSYRKIKNGIVEVNKKSVNVHAKVAKWQNKLDHLNAQNTLASKKAEIAGYIENRLDLDGNSLPGLESKYFEAFNMAGKIIIKDQEKARNLYEAYHAIKKGLSNGTDDDITNIHSAHKLRAELKLEQWKKVEETTSENKHRTKIRTVMALAYDISKIAIISMVIIGLVTGLSAMVPYLLATGVVGLVSNSLGWGKVLADDYNKAVPNPAVPEAAKNIEYQKDADGKVVKDATGRPVIARMHDYISKYTYFQATQPEAVFA